MWAILKVDLKNKILMDRDLRKKLGTDLKFYSPKLNIQIFRKNKIVNKCIPLLGDYVFYFHKKFSNSKIATNLRYVKGLKFFIYGHEFYQKEIELFITRCKSLENKKGFISQNFLKLNFNKFYKLKSGILANKIFELVEFQKNKIKILVNGLKIKTNQNNLIFDHN